MTVRITDIYNPKTFGRRIQEAQTTLNRFIASGIAVSDPLLVSQFSQGGNIAELTQFNPLTQDEPNYSSDDPAVSSTPAGINSKIMQARIAARNKSWSTMDLARELALVDPVGAITGRVGQYWATDDERRLIKSLLGVLADNEANDAGDMVVDVATDDAGAITDAERIGGDKVIDALQTLGDHKDAITTIALHSNIHARLQKQQLIQYERDVDSNIMFPTYLGKRLIIDDSLPAVAGTNRITYTCILFAPGAVATGAGRVLVPSEIDRIKEAGNGGGQDVIFSRVSNTFQPYGFSFTSTTVTGGGANSRFANYADLILAVNWDRAVDRKNVPMAFLKVND